MNFSALANILDTFSGVDAASLHVPTVVAAASAVGLKVPPSIYEFGEKVLKHAPPGMSVGEFIKSGKLLDLFNESARTLTAPAVVPTVKHSCRLCGNVEHARIGFHRCAKCDFLQEVTGEIA